jgi:hypothetical protein
MAVRHGALALVTEGGYDLDALDACVDRAIAAADSPAAWTLSSSGPGPRGERAVAAVRGVQSEYWRL